MLNNPGFNKNLIREAVKAARIEDPTKIGREPLENTPFKVQVESVRIRPTGGYSRAFAHWYSLVDNTNRVVFGAIDRADSFVSMASVFIYFRLLDDTGLAAYANDGWKAAHDEICWRRNNAVVGPA